MVESESLGDDEAKLLSLVPEDGPVGNTTLRRQLGWESERYFAVRNRLVGRDVLGLGRGRGGSIYRVGVPTDVTEVRETVPGFLRESELYAPIARVLDDVWAKELRFRNHLVEITAAQGRRDTGGMWTRPDLTVVAVSTYTYVLGTFFDVITFEIKPAGGWHDVKGVFETAAHSRFATRSYLIIHVPQGEDMIPEPDLERLQNECTRFEVGLGLIQDPGSYETWHFLLDPVRREPNPEDMDQFIDQQMSDESKRKIGQWKT